MVQGSLGNAIMPVFYILATLFGAVAAMAFAGANVFYAIIGACMGVILLFIFLAIIPGKR